MINVPALDHPASWQGIRSTLLPRLSFSTLTKPLQPTPDPSPTRILFPSPCSSTSGCAT